MAFQTSCAAAGGINCPPDIVADGEGRELVQHGSALFPIACYAEDVKSYSVAWHWHEEFEFILAVKGPLTVDVNKTQLVLRTGQGVLINSGVLHAVEQAESGNAQGAVDTLEAYLRTDPHNTKPRLLLADIIIHKLDDMKYGMMQLDVILDLEPDNVDALKAAVTVLSKHKKYNKETDEKFQRILELEPSAEMYNQYARFLRHQITDFNRAREYYEKAIAMDPKNYDYHLNYTVLLLNDVKDYAKAKSELEYLMSVKLGDMNLRKNYDKLMREKFDRDGNLKRKGIMGKLKR